MQIFIGMRQVWPYLGILHFEHPRGTQISTILRIFIPMSIVCIIVSGAWSIGYEGRSFVDISRTVMGLDLYFEVFFVYLIISIARRSFFQLFADIETKIKERKFELKWKSKTVKDVRRSKQPEDVGKDGCWKKWMRMCHITKAQQTIHFRCGRCRPQDLRRNEWIHWRLVQQNGLANVRSRHTIICAAGNDSLILRLFRTECRRIVIRIGLTTFVAVRLAYTDRILLRLHLYHRSVLHTQYDPFCRLFRVFWLVHAVDRIR